MKFKAGDRYAVYDAARGVRYGTVMKDCDENSLGWPGVMFRFDGESATQLLDIRGFTPVREQ